MFAYDRFELLHYNRALALYKVPDYVGAVAACDELIGLDPPGPHAYALRGWSFLWREKDRLAVADFTKAIDIASASARWEREKAWPLVGRARVYAELGELRLAIKDWTTLIEMHPDDPWHHCFRGRARVVLGDEARGADDLRRAEELDPDGAAGSQARKLLDSLDSPGW